MGEDWVKTWHINLPTIEQTPGQVNVKVILWLLNLAIAYDLVDYAKTRYNMLGNASHWFPGNKADKLSEIDLRSCLASSPHAHKIPQFLEKAHQILGGEEVKRLSQN